MRKTGKHNRIWLPAALLLTILLGFVSIKGLTGRALALEQTSRCGIEEHSHTDDCYRDGRRICSRPVHSHTENCYLVLLKDNDINTLLEQVAQQPDHSLETMIGRSVSGALQFNRNLTSPLTSQEVQASELAAINQTIETYGVKPQITLNENLTHANTGYDGDLPEDPQWPDGSMAEAGTADTAPQPELSGPDPWEKPQDPLYADPLPDPQDPLYQEAERNPADPLYQEVENPTPPQELDDPIETGSGKANYYIYLDGGWRTVGVLDFSTARSGTRYYARETTSEILDLYDEVLGISLQTSELHLVYASSATSGSWSEASTSGSYTYFGQNYSRQNTARAAKYVRLLDENGDPLAYYTVTLIHLDGTETRQYVRAGARITLPEDCSWVADGQEYAGGEAVTIHSPMTFRAVAADGKLRISYDVNFPAVSGVTVETEPTILGSALTELTDVVEQEQDARIRNVSQQEVLGKVNGNNVGLSRVIRFSGWRIAGTDTILSANSVLTWAELLNHVGDGSILRLEGVWEYRAQQTASFYIRYDSVAVDTEGNMTSQDSSLYTPELFATFVGGTEAATASVDRLNELYYIADTTSDNSFGADQAIRALYGQTTDVWLQSFPRDEDIFELLKDYAEYLQVDGEPVDVNSLNANGYTIRWYVFKCQSDAWHIDGRLVKKEGYLDVTKTFAGNKAAIAETMQDFHIHAVNEDGDKQYYFYIQQPTKPPEDGTVLLATRTGDTYLWSISGVEYGERWILTEYTGTLTDDQVIVHSSYRVVDGYNQQNKSGDGSQAEITGMTYATDMGDIQALLVEFTNIYHEWDSIIIKKEDASTGAPLDGAVFSLMQNGQLLSFSYDDEAERYLYDQNGAVTELVGNGYYELVIEGFSYDNGVLEVLELQAPDGYTPVEAVQLGYQPDGTVGILNPSEMAVYDNGLLRIRNTTDSTAVSVEKQWLCPAEEWQPVTVQLLANGQPVNLLIPGVAPSVELNEENQYAAVWEGLPRYANGAEIVWSVRETRIGNEDCLSNFTFANWLVDYAAPTYTYDETGRLVNTAFTVRNDTRRTMLRLIKTNLGGGLRLQGAEFRLERLLNGEPDSEFTARTMTTGPDGTLTFDNLKYGDYRLTELRPPPGYFPLEEAIYLTIQEDGTVEVQGHPYAMTGATAFSIQVLNQPEVPLPLTGGAGTGGSIAAGLLLMAAAAGGALLSKRRRGGVPES